MANMQGKGGQRYSLSDFDILKITFSFSKKD